MVEGGRWKWKTRMLLFCMVDSLAVHVYNKRRGKGKGKGIELCSNGSLRYV